YEEGINGVVQLGMRKPITETAIGNVFLAYDEELQKEYGSSLYSLSNLLISIKNEGFFIQEMGKATEIAMPVLYKGQITAVLSITTNTKRIRAQRLRNQAIRYLEQGARKLETIIVNRKRGNSIANAGG